MGKQAFPWGKVVFPPQSKWGSKRQHSTVVADDDQRILRVLVEYALWLDSGSPPKGYIGERIRECVADMQLELCIRASVRPTESGFTVFRAEIGHFDPRINPSWDHAVAVTDGDRLVVNLISGGEPVVEEATENLLNALQDAHKASQRGDRGGMRGQRG